MFYFKLSKSLGKQSANTDRRQMTGALPVAIYEGFHHDVSPGSPTVDRVGPNSPL